MKEYAYVMYDSFNRKIWVGETDNPMKAMYRTISNCPDRGCLVPVGLISSRKTGGRPALEYALEKYRIKGMDGKTGIWVREHMEVQKLLGPYLQLVHSKKYGVILDPWIVNYWMGAGAVENRRRNWQQRTAA